uniref:Uncharacterized protein n=1 Tax=Eptatretus burgeri TaxID=7764 RepID=A0A8C4QRY0_EPTBU
MVAFMDKEACNRVEEVEEKEEINIEKGRFFHSQQTKVTEYYEKKEKRIDQHRRDQIYNLMKEAQMKMMEFRENLIQDMLAEAGKKLDQMVREPPAYHTLLEGLILQGLFRLKEPSVGVCCRRQDLDIVKAVLEKVIPIYTEQVKRTVKVFVDSNHFLPADASGGIEVFRPDGKLPP